MYQNAGPFIRKVELFVWENVKGTIMYIVRRHSIGFTRINQL